MVLETKSDFIIEKDLKEIGKPLVIAGIPAFNEELTIAKIVLNAQKYTDVVVVCDDGSRDSTAEIAEHLGAVVIRHKQNSGYGAALQSIFKHAKKLDAAVLVTLDSDGQHNPAEIPLLIEPIEKRLADVVVGSRFKGEKGMTEMPKYRKFGIKVITKLSNSSAKNAVSDSQSGFRAYNKMAIDQLSTLSENGMGASIELLRAITKSGLNIFEVPVSCKYGDSIGVKTSSKHPFSHGVNLIMSLVKLVVEDRPITYLGIPGVACLAIGILFGIWMMNIYSSSHHIITNIALAAIGFLLLGCFMVSTAITLYAVLKISKQLIRTA